MTESVPDALATAVLARPAVELALLQARVEQLDRFYSDKFEAAARALETALETNNKRLDGMNEFRDALRDQAAAMITRKECESSLDAHANRNNAEIGAMRDKLNEIGRPNYMLFGSLASAFAVLVGGIWIVIGLKIDNSAIPIVLKSSEIHDMTVANTNRISDLTRNQEAAAVLQSASSAADLAGRADRVTANEKLATLQIDVANALKVQHAQTVKLTTRITRLSVWMDFLHAKAFPDGQPIPPLQPNDD